MQKNPSMGTDVHELDVATEMFAGFLADAEERGSIRAEELETLQADHDLDDDAVESLRAALVAAEVEIEEPSQRAQSRAKDLDLTPASTMSTDGLQLFLNEIGKHQLLTAADEVALAKRVEAGDLTAKERMVNSNLRLVVSIAKRYQGHDLPSST
jgi:RNA polymerase primary sigma factor